MEYSSSRFAYFDEKIYIMAEWNIAVSYTLMKIYKNTIWSITVVHMLAKVYVKRLYPGWYSNAAGITPDAVDIIPDCRHHS